MEMLCVLTFRFCPFCPLPMLNKKILNIYFLKMCIRLFRFTDKGTKGTKGQKAGLPLWHKAYRLCEHPVSGWTESFKTGEECF